MHFPLDTPELPLYPDLFAIRSRGVTKTRSGKRIIPRHKTDMFLPSMGRFGLRSGAVKFVILLDIYYFR